MPAFDKERTLRVAAECGLAVPPNRSPQSLEAYHAAATELGYPCVIKPRFSNPWDGSGFLPDRGVAYVAGPETLSQAVEARRQGPHWPLIQKYVTGRGIGLFALCDRGRPLVWFAHERLRDVRPSGSGSSLRRSVPVDSHLREAAERLLGGLEWHGPAMLEFRHDGARPWLMEMNGRFWGSLQLAVSAGVDFPALWVRLLLGESVAGPAVTRYRDGVAVRWLWGDVKRFFHILRGPPRGFPGEFPSRGQGFRELFGRQPTGTQLESWDRTDPWPAVGEWVQGLAELITWKRHHPALGKAS